MLNVLMFFAVGLVIGTASYRYQQNERIRLLNDGHDTAWAVEQSLFGMGVIRRFLETKILIVFAGGAAVAWLTGENSARLWAVTALVFGVIAGLTGIADSWVPKSVKTPLDLPQERQDEEEV